MFEAASEWLLECACIFFLPDIFHASVAKENLREIITAYREAIESSAETEAISK
jgi:hypothetical protein